MKNFILTFAFALIANCITAQTQNWGLGVDTDTSCNYVTLVTQTDSVFQITPSTFQTVLEKNGLVVLSYQVLHTSPVTGDVRISRYILEILKKDITLSTNGNETRFEIGYLPKIKFVAGQYVEFLDMIQL